MQLSFRTSRRESVSKNRCKTPEVKCRNKSVIEVTIDGIACEKGDVIVRENKVVPQDAVEEKTISFREISKASPGQRREKKMNGAEH